MSNGDGKPPVPPGPSLRPPSTTNLITDTSLPINAYAYGSGELTAIQFILSNSQIVGPDPSTGPMWFNQLGCMAGPPTRLNTPTNDDVIPNPGGPVTVTLYSLYPTIAGTNTVAQATVDLTNATDGQFCWSDVIEPFQLYGSDYYGQLNFTITIQTNDPDYWFYGNRPCVVRNGVTWGYQGGPTGDWIRAQGPGVDCNYVTYEDVSGNLGPSIALNADVRRRGELRKSALTPQVTLGGSIWRAGELRGGLAVPTIELSANLSGGPLWKPAKLCTG